MKVEGLIEHDSGWIKATTKGVTKIREQKFDLKRKVSDNPIATGILIIAVLSLLLNVYQYQQNMKIENEKNELLKLDILTFRETQLKEIY